MLSAPKRHRTPDVNSNLLLDLPRNTTFGWLPLIFIVGAEDRAREGSQAAG